MVIAVALGTCSPARSRSMVSVCVRPIHHWSASRLINDLNLCLPYCLLGTEHLSTYLKIYKVGDIVDVKVNNFRLRVRYTTHLLFMKLPRIVLWGGLKLPLSFSMCEGIMCEPSSSLDKLCSMWSDSWVFEECNVSTPVRITDCLAMSCTGEWCISKGDATQVLSWEDWTCVQCNQESSGCHNQQTSWVGMPLRVRCLS